MNTLKITFTCVFNQPASDDKDASIDLEPSDDNEISLNRLLSFTVNQEIANFFVLGREYEVIIAPKVS